jgi:hypothetical protein
MPEQIYMKLGVHIMAPEPVSAADCMNRISLCVYMCIPPVVAAAAGNTRSSGLIVLVMGPTGGPAPRRTGRQTVGRNAT